MYAGFLILLAGSHVLTGTIAINKLVARPEMCAVAWSVLAAVILFAFAIPKTFKDLTWFGYIDVLSVLSAVFIVIVAAAMGVRDPQLERDAVEWSWWPPADTSFDEIFLPVTNIIFAYSFSVCQYALMDEMHTPEDYMKSVWTLGLIEIVLYTVVGATLYVFVGSGVRELALLTGSPLISRIALGVALPVIFISGSINITVVAKYLVERCDSKNKAKLMESKHAWTAWITLVAVITILTWAIAEAVPFFKGLLGIISSLFVSGFCYYFPAIFWFFELAKDGEWHRGWKNRCQSIICACILLMGIFTLVAGSYSSVMLIIKQYQDDDVRAPFTCNAAAYL